MYIHWRRAAEKKIGGSPNVNGGVKGEFLQGVDFDHSWRGEVTAVPTVGCLLVQLLFQTCLHCCHGDENVTQASLTKHWLDGGWERVILTLY